MVCDCNKRLKLRQYIQLMESSFDCLTNSFLALDRLEIRDMFQSLGVPVSEQALSELMQKFDADGNDTITFDEFEAVALALEPKGEASPKKTFWKNLGATLKKVWNVAEDAKLDCGYLLSDIERIESLDVCNSEQTKIFANSSWAELCFSIFIKGREEPIILVCSKPEQRAAWIDALGVCIVNSIRFQSDAPDKKTMTSQLGWQHRRIRASISSLVLEEDLAGLQKQKVRPTPGVDINYRDPYHGYTALHYAVIMGNLEIAALLLSMSVMVNVKDKSDKTPLDYGKGIILNMQHATILFNKSVPYHCYFRFCSFTREELRYGKAIDRKRWQKEFDRGFAVQDSCRRAEAEESGYRSPSFDSWE